MWVEHTQGTQINHSCLQSTSIQTFKFRQFWKPSSILSQRNGLHKNNNRRNHVTVTATYEVTVNDLRKCRVFEKGLDTNTKKLVAEVKVPASAEQVWQILTDYENLPKFVPNLVECEKLKSKKKNVTFLRQKACSQSLYWRLEAEAVLAVRERTLQWGAKELYFKLIQGDFEQFEGKWIVDGEGSVTGPTILRYEVNIVTMANIPKSIVRHVIRAGLPANVLAVAKQAEKLAEQSESVPELAKKAMLEKSAPIPQKNLSKNQNSAAYQSSDDSDSEELQQELDDFQLQQQQQQNKAKWLSWMWNVSNDNRLVYMGVTSIPVPPLNSDQVDQFKDEEMRKIDSVRRKQVLMQLQKGKSKQIQQNAQVPYVNEVHLRRLDTVDKLHRRVVVQVDIGATVDQIWDVLTDYENLPEFVPNLAQCKILGVRRTNKPHKYLRLRQVVYKCMPYVCFHAECHLDVSEIPQQEIQFKQVQGDFEVLQGKWIIQKIKDLRGPPSQNFKPPVSSLQYAIEMVVPKSNQLFSYIEPLLDKFAVEDLAINLAAFKHKIEFNQRQIILQLKSEYFESIGNYTRALILKKQIGRPLPSEMENDFEVLKGELIRCYGDMGGYMPVQSELLDDARRDIVVAMIQFGGPHAVAERMGWKMKYPRRPRGYWMDVESLGKEMEAFLEEHNLPQKTMPARLFLINNGRKDLVRAIENHYGGFIEVAMRLGWELSKGCKQRVLPDKALHNQFKQKLVLSTHEMDVAFIKSNNVQYTVEDEEKQVKEIMEKYQKEIQDKMKNEDNNYMHLYENGQFDDKQQQQQQNEEQSKKSKSYSDLDEEDSVLPKDIIMGM